MSEALIRLFSSGDLNEVEEIFFGSSSKKDFKDENERRAFRYKYLGYYLEHYPELAWVAQGERVLGYCVASPQSTSTVLWQIQPHLEVFEEKLKDYPAHLHINLAPEARGQGLGAKLIQKCEEALQGQGIPGLHIMTSPVSRNRSFYRRLGFQFEVELPFRGTPILLMGKRL